MKKKKGEKIMKRKISVTAILVSMAMLLSVVPSVFAADLDREFVNTVPANGYCWMESDEAYTKRHDTSFLNASGFSGTNPYALAVVTKDTHSSGAYYWEFNLNVEEAGQYDICVRGTQNDYTWNSNINLNVNGNVATLSNLNNTAWVKANGNDFKIDWNKATVNLVAGSNTLKFYVDQIRPSGEYYYAVLDAICVVPTRANWTPSLTDMPVVPKVNTVTDGYYWMEAETDNYDTNLQDISNTSLSGGKSKGKTIATAPGADGYYIDFKVNVETAGTYKVYERGSQHNITNHSNTKCKVDGVEQTVTVVSNDSVWTGEFKYGWNEVDVALTAGEHTIRFYYDEIRGTGTYYQGAVDCLCMIPNYWNWTPSITAANRPTAPKTNTVTDGYYWLEAESDAAATNLTYSYSHTSLSGTGKGIKATATAPGADGYYIDFIVNFDKTGDYKLYLRTSSNDYSNDSNFKCKIDGVDKTVTKLSEDGNWSGDYKLGWNTVSTNITAGVHTLRFYFDELRPLGQYYNGAMDFVCITPDFWGWTPSATVRPVAPLYKSYAFIDVNDEGDVADLFGSKAHIVNTLTEPADATYGYYSDYEFGLDRTNSYDIWIRSCDNATTQYMSPYNIYIDGALTGKTYKLNEQWFKLWNSGLTTYAMGWSKITVDLTEGHHTLKWSVNQKGSGGKYFAMLDAIIVMPSAIGFAPTALDNEDTLFNYDLSSSMAAFDLANITENMTLPSTTPAGRSITWSTSDASIISASGVVTRIENVDKKVTLTATTSDGSKDFVVTVAKIPAYSITGFEFVDANNQNISNAVNGATIKSVAKIKNISESEKPFVMIIAHYGNDILKYAKFNSGTIAAGETKDASVEYTIEGLEDGDYISAFIWNNLDDIVPLSGINSLN